MSWNPISNLVEDSIQNWFTSTAEKAIDMYVEFLNVIQGASVGVLEFPIVQQGMVYVQALALLWIGSKFGFEIWFNYLLRQNGDSEADVSGVLIQAAQAIAICTSVPWIVKQMYTFGTNMAKEIALLSPDTNINGEKIQSTMKAAFDATTFQLMIAIAVIYAIVLLIVILIQTFIRAAEIAVAGFVGSAMATGLTNSSSQAFQSWWREVINLTMAQPLQIFLVKCSFYALLNFNFSYPWVNLFLFIGFLWVTYKSPTTLKQYVYSTGAAKAVGGAGMQVGSMMMMRKLMTKGV